MLNPEIWAGNSENSNKIGNVFEPCAHVMFKRHEYLMSSKGDNYAKEETRTFRHTNAPAVGPDIKSTGARMHLQHAM